MAPPFSLTLSGWKLKEKLICKIKTHSHSCFKFFSFVFNCNLIIVFFYDV